MSTGFNWFKGYKIKIEEDRFFRDVTLNYLDGDSTSHSCANIIKVQELIEKYSGERIPIICEDFIQSEDEKLPLIEPSVMSQICEKILQGTEVDKVDMRYRIEWFKKLSDEGYYITYDYR